MELDIAFAGGWPEDADAAAQAEAAAEAVLGIAPELANERLSASLLFTGASATSRPMC